MSTVAKYVYVGEGRYERTMGDPATFAESFRYGRVHSGSAPNTETLRERMMTRAAPAPVAAPPVPRPVVTWDDLGHSKVAQIKRENPKRFEALKAERHFRMDLRMLDADEATIVTALNRRKRPDLIEQFRSLREALRQ